MRKQGLMRRVAALLVVAMVAGLMQTAGLGTGKANANPVDALSGLSWIKKPAITHDSTEMFRTAAYGAGTIVAAGTPTMYFPVNDNDNDSNPNNDTDDLLDMHGGNFYETSDTGASWTTVDAGIAHELRSLVYGPTGFVGVGYGQQIQYGQQSYHGKIMRSNDGVSWESITALPHESGTQLFGITTNGTDQYVAVGALSDIDFNQTPVILTSDDGTAWSAQASAVSSGAMNAVTYGNGQYVAVGSGGVIQTSSNGMSWTQQSSGVTATLRGVTYGNGKFVAVGSSSKILTSSNGTTWSAATPPVSGTFNSIAYGDGTFVIAGNGGVIMSSQDGSNWTKQTSNTTQVLYGAAYVNDEFMVLGANGTILMAQHKLSYSADANGTISGDSEQGVRPGGSGTAVMPVANTGYEFDSWNDGLFAADGGERTDSSIAADINAIASFKRIILSLTYDTSGNGHIDGSTNQQVPYGDGGTAVTAVADDDNHFVQWSDGITTATRTDLNVTATKTITAQFAIDTYNVTYTAGTGGTISGTASQIVDVGKNGSAVTATPNTGYHFVKWNDNATEPTRTENNVRSNLSFTASFAIDTFALKYRAGNGGSLTGGDANQTVNYGQAAAAVTAVPATGYSFVEWSDHVTTATRTDLNVTHDIDVQALFSINKYTLSYLATTGGSVSGSAAQSVDYDSDGSEVTAVADTGYHFVKWDDNKTTSARQDKNVTADKTYTASFEINTYQLKYSAGDHGTVDGTLQQTVNYGADGTEVTATPATGYHFVKWSDNNTAANRTDEDVDQDITVSASFAINQYTLDYEAGPGGSLTGSAHQSVNYNADGATVTAVANTGYQFVSWSDGITTATRQDVDVVASKQVTATFAIDTFVLTYTAGANGTITGTTPQTVDYGADGTTVTAVPAAGYHFVKWSDNVQDASRQDTDVTGAITVTAQFAIDTFALNYTAGAGGSIDGDKDQVVERGASGSEVTAVPATGYHFVEWSDGKKSASRTDAGVNANVSVSASFAINQYTLTYAAGANGMITGTTPQTVDYGTDGTTVTAVPNAGYHFTGWSDSKAATSRKDTGITADLSVTANFAINDYSLTYTAGLHGSLTGDTDQSVTYLSDGTEVTAVPAAGYHFVDWSDGKDTASRTDTSVADDLSVTANFAINEYTLTYTAGLHGTLTGNAGQTVNHGSDGATVVAVPATGYHFVDWSDGKETASRKDTGITADLNVTANFAINQYTLTYTAGANGTLTGDPDQIVNHGADGTTVVAVPAAGYHFVDWSDGKDTASRTDTGVTGVISVTANFAINEYTLTYVAGSNGTLTGNPDQTVKHGSDGTTVTAVPATGYHFVNWSDGKDTASRKDTGITADLSVTANFAINQYTLAYSAGANGTLTGDTEQTVNHGADGTSVTAVPAANYHFVDWSDGKKAATRTDTGVTGGISVTANFAINEFTLTYTAGTNGTLTGDTDQTVAYGSDGTIVTAVPATGYHFVGWSDGKDTASRTDTSVAADLSVTANFAINEYTLTYTAGLNGTLTGDAGQTVTHGSDGTTVVAVPATGYHFVEWSDGKDTASRKDTGITADLSVTASFAINQYTLTYTAGSHGTLTGDPDQIVNYGSDGTIVTAVPVAGYHFVDWSDGKDTASRTDIDVTAVVSVTANFAINEYSLTYVAGSNGTLTGDPDQTVAYGSNGTVVTAVPAAGYHFVDWSDGKDTASRTDTSVADNLSVTANFAINEYTLTYIVGANGTLTGNANQTVTHGSDGTTVTAVPKAGYRFVSWSDGVTTAERTDLNIGSDITATATFKHITTNTGNGSGTSPTEGAEVIIDGKPFTVGELHDSVRDGQSVTTVTLDEGKLKELLASEGQAATITIPVNTDADIAVGQLSGDMLQQLIAKEATLRIETEGVVYSLPTQLIDLEAMAKQFGTNVQASDLTVSVEIGKPTAAAAAAAQQAAKNGDVEIIAPPVSFSVHFSYNGQSIELSAFSSYVERMIAIPGVNAKQEAATAVIVEPDGTLRHVPTKMVQEDGKWYAVVNSLTNSMYAVVKKSVHFTDIANHWAKDAIVNMGSRTIVGGTGNGLFEPNKAITRAEFAAIMVRALGLKLVDGTGGFTDVQPTAWYADAVQTAYAHQLINGFEDGSFRPNASITREQAMTMIAKALKITGIGVNLQAGDADALLSRFADKASAGGWAVAGIAACLQSGIVSGQSASALAPKANITRAEVAVIIERLLVKSSLI
ncbi:InlB B-repeat-containing protein [Paenibacillus albus]|uniref:SLH domain-containing protein n=1 Tax=Paenibacillus albus TaxID=2495582 RepID=A0A3S9A0F1_9BACL|nr:InlB B-repeat-containing protein [Paenibacillus albus]AZN39211.1 hypothetical protein EJC50_05680 [Paenibacillus albus]